MQMFTTPHHRLWLELPLIPHQARAGGKYRGKVLSRHLFESVALANGELWRRLAAVFSFGVSSECRGRLFFGYLLLAKQKKVARPSGGTDSKSPREAGAILNV